MSKYGDVIRQARQSEETASGNQPAEKPVRGNEVKPENQKTGKPENRPANPPQERGEEVNLSIKVSKTLRRHWASEAKRQDTTLTAVIIEALKSRFGEPTEL